MAITTTTMRKGGGRDSWFSVHHAIPITQAMISTGVKGFVLDLLRERAADGLNAAIAVEIASSRGVLMDRGSVSSLLSRLKQDDIVTYDDNMYRLKEFSSESAESEDGDSPKVAEFS